MRRVKQPNDLVVSMTLAEIFLLLLIVGWYGARLESEAIGTSAKRPVDVVERELSEVKAKLDDLSQAHRRLVAQVREYKRLLNYFQVLLRSPEPFSNEDAIAAALKRYGEDARRGKPSCREANVLLTATVSNGRVSGTTLQMFDSIPAGTVLRGDGVNAFLGRLDRFYRGEAAKGTECAFDYTLGWRTDADYRTGRQFFERFFYLARERRLDE